MIDDERETGPGPQLDDQNVPSDLGSQKNIETAERDEQEDEIREQDQEENADEEQDKEETDKELDRVENAHKDHDAKDDTGEPEHTSTSTLPKISAGPYSLVPLIDSIPTINSEVPETTGAIATCIEAWESNIYVGTSKGELLHFFKLDDFGYMLISRQRISSKTTHPVQKIAVIPSVSRALVLYNSAVSCFMMPEMSPLNIGRIKDVRDICFDVNSYTLDQKRSNKVIEPSLKNQNGVICTLLTGKSLRFVLVTSETMQLVRDMNYPNAYTGVRRSKSVLVASKNANYDMLELDKSKKTQLFPVSSVPLNDLTPHVVPVALNEYLLTCGTRDLEPAIGMVVNGAGEVSRGTISWSAYPSSVICDYPYALASINNKIVVNSIQDQQLLQEMEFPNVESSQGDVKIQVTSHLFSQKFDETVELLRLSPLVASESSTEDLVESERLKLAGFANVTSSTVVYGSGIGVLLLVPTPMLQRVLGLLERTHLESIYDDIQDELKALDRDSLYGQKQKQFAETLSTLVLLKHNQFDRAFEYFIDHNLDPRLLVYLFQKDLGLIYDDLWVFNGLKPLISELRDVFSQILYGEDEQDDNTMVLRFATDEFYKMLIKNYFQDSSIEKSAELMRSVEVIHFMNELESLHFKSIQDIDDFVLKLPIKHSVLELIQLLQTENRKVVLISIYKSQSMHHEVVNSVIELLESDNGLCDSMRLLFDGEDGVYQFLVDYILKYFSDEDQIWHYVEWLLDHKPSFGVQLLGSKELQVELSESKIMHSLNSRKLYESSETFLKLLLFDRNEIQFLGDLIYELVRKFVTLLDSDEQLVALWKSSVEIYKTLEVPKLSFPKFLSMEFRNYPNQEVCQLHNRIFNYVLIASKDSITLTRDQNVSILAHCKEVLMPYKEAIPYLMILMEFKLESMKTCIKSLCDLTDFKTAEYVAVRLAIPFNLSNFDEKIDKFIELHRSKVRLEDFEEFEDDEVTLAARSEGDLDHESDKAFSEELLLQIFESYLKLNHFKLIESFLGTHHLFDVSLSDEADDFGKLEQVLSKLPGDFPVAMINRFLSTSLVRLKDKEQNKIQTKNLQKAVNKKLKLVKKDLMEK